MRWSAILVVGALGATAGCAEDQPTAVGATSCTELVEASLGITRDLLIDLGDLTLAEVRADVSEDPFAFLREPYAGLDERARELGCGDEELVRLACEAFPEIAPLAQGEVADSFLADYFAACD